MFADRPLPPRNVGVSDIKADSCYLTWEAPEDNGGSEITNYIVERRDASKKKSDFEVLTVNLIDRRYGVSHHGSSWRKDVATYIMFQIDSVS